MRSYESIVLLVDDVTKFPFHLSGLFDHGSGSIDINGFAQLYNYVNQWLGAFRSYDKNQSGYIDNQEFMQALQAMGYRFSQQFIDTVAAR